MDIHTQVGEIIKKTQETLPETIERIDYEVGVDYDGDDAVRVWVILKDEDIPTQWTFEERSKVRRAIFSAIHESGLPHWPFISFRATSEEPPLLIPR
ncbi:MAG: hypothetical protein AAGG51_02505 [Cyanobacteria bacterium P01_G01_bin.54]